MSNLASDRTKLCAKCSTIVLPGPFEEWHFDHGSVDEIIQTARTGCILCSLLEQKFIHIDDQYIRLHTTAKNRGTLFASLVCGQGSDAIIKAKHHFHIQSLRKSPATVLFHRTKQRAPGDSQKSTELAKRWISTCTKQHKSCVKKLSTLLPTRVLDLTEQDPKWIRLQVNNRPSPGIYAALSYCWGTSNTFTTTSETLAARMAGFSIKDLPQTLQDAVKITRHLGIRYLWIDALCILQGSDTAAFEDWIREGSGMEQVYANAYVTIIAAASRDSDGGLFTPRTLNLPFCRNDNVQEHVDIRTGFVQIILPERKIKNEPINSRAWALQERLLSPRTLIYTSGEMVWQCNHHTTGERHDQGLFPKSEWAAFTYRLPPLGVRPDWNRLVADYCSRNMTNEKDKFPAIAGLAWRYHHATGDAYFAGLWSSSLLSDLLWGRLEAYYGNSAALFSPKTGRPDKYRAPSWSWASVDGTISWMYADKSTQIAKVLSCHTDLVSLDDPFGMVTGGYLCIKGLLRRVTRDGGPSLIPLNKSRFSTDGMLFLDDEDDVDVQKALESDGLYVFFLYKRMGLVLRPVPARLNYYTRVGVFNEVDESSIDGLSESLIFII